MVAVFTSEIIGYGGAGPLGCVSAAFVALSCWSKQGWEIEDNPAATAFEIFWMICQPVLFGIAGARIKLNEINGNVVSISLGILVTGVVVRILVTTLVGIGCKLNLKEKIFVAIAWMCKAIVQVTNVNIKPINLLRNEVHQNDQLKSKSHKFVRTMSSLKIKH